MGLIQVNPEPGPGFDEPLEVFAACHERIEAQLQTLERLAAHLEINGCDDAARSAARAVMRYFDIAGPKHQADEEHDLFPVLCATATADGRADVPEIVAGLLNDHARMDVMYRPLRERLAAIETGETAQLDVGRVGEFVRLYRTHIECESEQLMPYAARALTAREVAAIGARMAQRRGVTI